MASTAHPGTIPTTGAAAPAAHPAPAAAPGDPAPAASASASASPAATQRPPSASAPAVEAAPGTASLLGAVLVLAAVKRALPDPAAAEATAAGLLAQAPQAAGRALAKALGLGLRFRRRRLDRLDARRLPLAFRARGGGWAVLARLDDAGALVQVADRPRPDMVPLEALAEAWSGEIAELHPGRGRAAAGAEGVRPFDISWFIPEFMRLRAYAWEVLAASATLELLALLAPLFFQVVIDKVLVHQAESTLDVLVAALVAVSVLEVALKGLRQYVATHAAVRIDARLGGKLFARMIDLPISYFKARSVGLTVMRLRELDSIRAFLTGAANTLIIDLAFTGVFFSIMWLYSPLLTLIVAGSVPFYIALSVAITPPLQRRIEAMCRDGAINNAFLTETLNGIETVKALALEPALTRRWERQTQGFVHSNFQVQRLMQISANLVTLIQKLTMVAVMWVGARMVIDLELSIGQLVAFNMMAGHVAQPIVRLAELWRNYVQARVSIDRLGDVLDTPAERAEGQAQAPARPAGRVTFERVTFRYALGIDPILRDFDLEIPAGTMVAFVGPSGSGKSTVAKLVQKLYVPDAGRILIDGQDLAGVDAVSLRRRMSVVLQENHLFNRSVRENIALTDPAAPLSRVTEAAQAGGAHEFILEMKDGYDTVLAEGGASLSGGQRQRVAIARALLPDPAILILDEATSALDDRSQEIVQRNMERIRKGRTVIVIAHRLSTVRDCDRIFVLDKGRIVESGDHSALLARGGVYARLWAMQAGDRSGLHPAPGGAAPASARPGPRVAPAPAPAPASAAGRPGDPAPIRLRFATGD